jgi:ABC-type glycerol-3-phosphate transport system substrate-binding protein
MQLEYRKSRHLFVPKEINYCSNDHARFRFAFYFSSIGIAFALLGCRQPPNLVDPKLEKPFEGKTLTLAISSQVRHPQILQQFARDWSERTGAKIEFLPDGWGDQSKADIAIVLAPEMPKDVVQDRIRPVPDNLRSSINKFSWGDIPVAIGDKIASWNAKIYSLPLLNEGLVLVYRTDVWQWFQESTKTRNSFPDTWDQLVQFAEAVYQKEKKPSLPPLSKRNEQLFHDLHRLAISYDRLVVNESNIGQGPKTPEEKDLFFSFDFSIETGLPRIHRPAFVHALQLLQSMQAYRPAEPSDDPDAAFASGNAVAALVRLDALPRFQNSEVIKGKFNIAPIPGSRFTFAPDAKSTDDAHRIHVASEGFTNRVPYLGEGCWLGMVTKSCAHPEIAFDFLTEFSHPSNASLEWISAGKWGASGFRVSHFDTRNRNHWFGYGFDSLLTDRLVEIQRQNLGIGLANYSSVLRVPDQKEYQQILIDEVLPSLKSRENPEKVLERVATKWQARQLDKLIYRISLGL